MNIRKVLWKERMCSFTLIELLVCVSMIAILMTLLLPMLRQAKENAYKVLCTSNLKQVATVSSAYMGDNNAWMPTYSSLWNAAFYNNGYLPIPEAGKQYILVCPSHFTSINENKGTWTSGGRSYGMRYYWGRTFKILGQVNDSKGVNRGNPARFILFADSNHATDAIDYQWYIFQSYTAGHTVHLRHLNRCNVLFADGHTDSLSDQQLTEEYSFIPASIVK
jgi:prepilin-type processing-associated H-X9-DG protein